MNKLLKSAFSLALALALVFSLGTAAFAEEYDIDKGSITVNATESGRTVTQVNGVTDYKETTPTVIKDSSSSSYTNNTVTIEAAEGQTADVTLKGVYIQGNDTAAVTVKGNGTVNIELDGIGVLQGGNGHAGIEKGVDGTLNINDSNGDAAFDVYGGYGGGGAGIGGGKNQSTANININMTSDEKWLNATGYNGGAGIGGGANGDGTNITINSGKVAARSYGSENTDDEGDTELVAGSGIGGGSGGNANNISIINGEVKAKADAGAAGIGGGVYAKFDKDGNLIGKAESGACQNVTISGKSNVTASTFASSYGTIGAPIGTGADGKTPGKAVSPDVKALSSDGKAVLEKYEKTDDSTYTLIDSKTIDSTFEGFDSDVDNDGSSSGVDNDGSAAAALPADSATAAAPLSARYSVTIGKNQTWLTGSDDGLEFTLNSENVVKVLIDGEEVEFELNDNGDIVISAEVLQALEAGEHEIEFVFADGSCKTVFTVK